MQGWCARGDECVYLHADVLPDAPACTAFLQGSCPRGASCPHKHLTTAMIRHYNAHPDQYAKVLDRSLAAGIGGKGGAPSTNRHTRNHAGMHAGEGEDNAGAQAGEAGGDGDGDIDRLLFSAREDVESYTLARRVDALRLRAPPGVFGAGFPRGRHPHYAVPSTHGDGSGPGDASDGGVRGTGRMPVGDLPDARMHLGARHPDLRHVGGLLFMAAQDVVTVESEPV